MKIAIVGSGGVGGYFGGRLANAGHDVWFMARGAHLDAMRTRGLRIESPLGGVHLPAVNVTADPVEAGPADVVLFAVKLYDTDGALPLLPPLLAPHTVVIPLQNGVDSVPTLAAAIGARQVAGGTAAVSAVIDAPGVIRHVAFDRLTFGALDPCQRPMLEAFRDAGTGAGFAAVLSDEPWVEIWLKFVRLTVFSGMTSIVRAPIGAIRESPLLMSMMEAAWNESIAVALAAGIALPPNVRDQARGFSNAMPAHAKASMLEDLERGRRLELPWLSGALVRIARGAGVSVPTHELIVALLQPHVNGRKESSS